ncbi:MAG: hypothetical protein Q4F67_14595 [Propionibacteriaceae bacterium]|nr:hypothetical protein [Propionibacteriaceae bacterium]
MRTVHGYRSDPAWRIHADVITDSILARPGDYIAAALILGATLGIVGYALKAGAR